MLLLVKECNGSFGARDRFYEDLPLLLGDGLAFNRNRLIVLHLALKLLIAKCSTMVRSLRLSIGLLAASHAFLFEHFRADIFGDT